MKFKIAIELPTRAALVAGLTPRELHPLLVRAEQHAAEAEQALVLRRHELADREQTVANLPVRIHRGDVKASALTDALRERDVEAMLVAPAEEAAIKARVRVTAEEKNAKAAVERELVRRVELLEAAAAQVAPVLDEINDLASSLAATLGQGAVLASIEWPSSPADGASRRNLAGATPMPLAYGNAGGAK